MRNLNPKNRKTEVLALFMVCKNKWLSHNDFASELQQINSHKYISFLEKDGVQFTERNQKFKNRFNRSSTYKQFKLKTDIKSCKEIFDKLNN